MQSNVHSSLIYKIALTHIPGVGPVLAKNLLGYCGSVEAIFTEKVTHLTKIPGIGINIAKAVHAFKNFDKAYIEADFIQKNKIEALFFFRRRLSSTFKKLQRQSGYALL
jgi:DNA processing protein